MTKEEETSTSSSTLSRLKYHISILFGAKTCKNYIWCDSISLLNAFEVEWRVHIYLNDRVNIYLVNIDLALILQLLCSLPKTRGHTGFGAVILMEILHLHNIPDCWVFDLDRI